MKIDTMRRIDRWAGVPLCFLLTRLRRLFLAPRTRTRPRRILFIELSEMGSTILADPAMRRARERHGAELFFAIFRKNAPSLELLDTVPADNVFTIDERGLLRLAASSLRFLSWCRRQEIDTVIDLELFSRFTALLTGLSGAANRVGFHRHHAEGLYRGDLLTHRVLYNPHQHIAANFMALVNALDESPAAAPLSRERVEPHELTVPPREFMEAELAAMREQLVHLVPGYDPGAHRLVLVNPNAGDMLPQRRWPGERYLQVIRALLERHEDILVLLTGSGAERGATRAMAREIGDPRCQSVAGAFALPDMARLYAVSACMLTNDSGPGHFAAAAALPVVVLFGPETPALYGPLGPGRALHAGLSCSPCVSAANHRKTTCRDNRCMRAITVDQVLEALEPLLAREEDRTP